eukprot:533461-Heterocapsa_arctica.AAC.1
MGRVTLVRLQNAAGPRLSGKWVRRCGRRCNVGHGGLRRNAEGGYLRVRVRARPQQVPTLRA